MFGGAAPLHPRDQVLGHVGDLQTIHGQLPTVAESPQAQRENRDLSVSAGRQAGREGGRQKGREGGREAGREREGGREEMK